MTLKKDIGLLFDMDGVIVDNNQYHIEAWKIFCSKYGMEMTAENYRNNINGRTARDIIYALFGEVSSEVVKKYSHEKEGIYRELYRPHLTATPGLTDFLELAKSSNIPMAVGTSAPTENANFILDGLKLRSFFTAVLDENNVTNGKPNPEIYLNASSAIGKKAESCIVFEDAVMGIRAGKAAGCKIVALTTSHTAEELPESDMKINNFKNLKIDTIFSLFRD